ncbi:site-2 protease family protein [Saccharomonospora viridis]|nr:site-2 protease family protein [Saccharomonospora viridis]SFO78372.1 Zn-dependent protease (includes SpoIVFB) [Saccharomonospora viridis]
MLLFRVSGVPVLLAGSWWIGSLLIVALYTPLVTRMLPDAGLGLSAVLAGAFAVLLGLSVLAHELGHCLVALRFGMPVRRVRLFLLGGLSELVRSPRRPQQEALVALAGPGVSIALALVCWVLLLAIPADGAVWLLVAQCAVANGAVGVFNLLPGLPLDGGRLLRAGVWALRGTRSTGTRVAVVGGGLVAVALLGWALWGLAQGSEDRWLRLGVGVVTAWFVAMGATTEFASEGRRTWPKGLSVTDLMRPVLQLPAESPVSAALTASAGRGVVLVRADGVAAGLLDTEAAERLAASAPDSPAELAAQPIRAETVLVTSDSTDEIAEHVNQVPAWQFLVVDADSRPMGVLCRDDVHSALAAPSAYGTGPART